MTQIIIVILIALSLICLSRYRKQCLTKFRIKQFENDYPIFLISLASSIRCGVDPLAGITQVKKLFNIKAEIFVAITEFESLLATGASEREAILMFGKDMNHPDLVLFREAFCLARSQGASLSSALHRIAKVVRYRQSFRRKARAAVAMQKLSGFGILIAISLMLIVQIISSSTSLIKAWEDPIGVKLILLSVLLILIGTWGILKIGSLNIK